VLLLTLLASLGSMALPALAREAAGSPFVEVQPEEVLPNGAPSAVVTIEPDTTVPEDDTADGEPEPAEDPADPDQGDGGEDDPLAPPTTEPANDLSDIPDYPVPAGYRILDRWNDGDDLVRSTIWAAPSGDAGALVVYLSADRGGWSGVDLSGVTGVDPSRQWLYERGDHPYCLWIEYYDKGLEREELELETGLVGPQFLVVETPWCRAAPDPYT
jgi:hypothetical protein